MRFFSILVPVYNVEKYLRECLESIRRQTFEDFEVIVVDDGSTDASSVICDEYAAMDERFRVFHRENGGITSVRKAGAARASGEYLVNVDGDDVIEEDFLFEMHRLVTEKSPDLIACGRKLITENGEFLLEWLNDIEEGYYAGESLTVFTSKLLYDKNREGFNCGCVGWGITTKIVKTSIFKECINKVDNRVVKGEDLVAFLYMMQKAKSVLTSNYSGYHYRQQSSSIMHTHQMEDLHRQAILRDEIYRGVGTDSAMISRASVCVFAETYKLLLQLIGPATSYRQFMDIIQVIENYRLFDCIKKMDIFRQRFSFTGMMKVLVVRFRCWWILYNYEMRKMKRELA